MARPIKETPILEGENALRFEKIMTENETKKVSSADYDRAVENCERIIPPSCFD